MCTWQVATLVSRQHMGAGWGELEWGIRTGGPIFEKVHGRAFWEYLGSADGLEQLFSQGMADLDNICALLSALKSFHPCARQCLQW